MNHDIPTRVDFSLPVSQYEHEALSYLALDSKEDKIGVLRKGLIEEACEVCDTEPSDSDEYAKEIGDVIWYCTAIAHLNGSSISELLGDESPSLTEACKNLERADQLPIVDSNGMIIDRSENITFAFLIDVLRLIDTLNPKSSSVWDGIEQTKLPNLESAVQSVVVSAHRLAESAGINTDVAAHATLVKLGTRQRMPHVITEQNTSGVDSVRERVWTRLEKYSNKLVSDVLYDQEHS